LNEVIKVENLEKELATTIANFEQRLRDETERNFTALKQMEKEISDYR